jgi:alkylation response protein AidB-like acyl-CoA dehydrogenase
VKTAVPTGTRADLLLVTATTPSGSGLFLVEPGAEGVSVLPQRTSDGDVAARVELADARGEPLGEAGAATRLGQLLLLAACAEQLGVTEGALALTSTYAKEREQFGRPIGTFQAVSQRLADGYIDVLGQGLTLWQAAWRLEEGLPAETELAVAKLWAADAGHRLAHTTIHVHGGVGIDLDGEAHRFFTTAKRFEFAYGGTTEQALRIGRALAAEPA